MNITIKNRSYKIVSTQQPKERILAINPDIVLFHVAEGKRGAIIAVAELKDGSFRII